MKTFAQINNGVVVNGAVGNNDWNPGSGWVDVTDHQPPVGIGWTYTNGVFSAPPEPVITLTKAERVSVLRRFTPTELHAWRRAVVRAEATNTPAAADRQLCYGWHLWIEQPEVAEMENADIVQLATWLVQHGVLANAQRAKDVFAPEA